MKKLGLLLSALLAIVAIGCSSSNKETNEEKASDAAEITAETPTLEGYWRLKEYVATDGSIKEVPQDVVSILQFHQVDHQFGLTTDCNHIGGQYRTVEDSISFENISQTLMECPSMAIEEAMNALLPRVDTYAINPDSILRLRSDMRIMATFVRTPEEALNEESEN